MNASHVPSVLDFHPASSREQRDVHDFQQFGSLSVGLDMRILGRDSSLYKRHIPRFPRYVWYLCKCLFVVKAPFKFIYAYLSASTPPSGLVELRNGLRICLSGHPHDVITVFAIFIREDYGRIDPGSKVVDIGANIGVFSLYAAFCRADKVYAYEPNSESYQSLVRNIQINDLQNVIVPHQLAVTSKNGQTVKFPVKSSMYNSIITDDSCSEYELVETTNLETIIENTKRVDLVKMDCEGAEYDVLLNSNHDIFTHVASIRMEFHCGHVGEVSSFLQQIGFAQSYLRADSEISGTVWYQK
jgi:FkbM family methyltransferase